MRRLQSFGILCLVVSLTLFALGGWVIERHRAQSRNEEAIGKLSQYIADRMQLDSELYEQELALRRLHASVKGTVAILFDHCAPNAYEVAFEWMTAYEMAGGLVFRDVLPGQAGAITQAQWKEMQAAGWTAVLASPDNFVDSVKEAGYVERVLEYADKMLKAFEEMGCSIPRTYSFFEGECSQELMIALVEKGFIAFSAPDVETAAVGENAFLLQELYLMADPNAPLLQPIVSEIRNKADGYVIKTRYVDDGGDLQKDTTLAKLRQGVLPSLAAYRKEETISLGTPDLAAQICRQQRQIQTALEDEKTEITENIRDIRERMDLVWQEYFEG